MRQTAVEWVLDELDKLQFLFENDKITVYVYIEMKLFIQNKAKEMDKQQKIEAYQHGRDDENCALSDGAMSPDYDNAEEWYKGEYGGEQ